MCLCEILEVEMGLKEYFLLDKSMKFSFLFIENFMEIK